MSEPVWLDRNGLLDAHARQQVLFGGLSGMRDLGAFESALARPMNKWSFGERDLAELAAAYAYGIARNHPFVDGNKRMAFIAMVTFLDLNGVEFDAPDDDAIAVFLNLAAGQVSEEALARVIRERWI